MIRLLRRSLPPRWLAQADETSGRQAGAPAPWLVAVLLVLLASSLAGCSDVELTPAPVKPTRELDVKVSLTGSFFSRQPEEVLFPVKVLFVVDTSQSMNVTDPVDLRSGNAGRTRAVQEVAELIMGSPGVSMAVVAFNGGTNILTQVDTDGDGTPDADGFSPVRDDVLLAVAELNFAGSTTDYESALEVAHMLLAADMDASERLTLSRAKYVVIFHSDGLPNPVSADANNETSILQRVEDIRSLVDTFNVRELVLHTTYLSANTPPTVRERAGSLLRKMAERGGGTFRNFEHGEQIDFLAIDFTAIRRQFALKSFVVANFSARPLPRLLHPDSDGDGLDDALEELEGLNPHWPDSDGDGLDDLSAYRLAHPEFDPQLRVDTDADGLDDSLERSIGSDPLLPDSDGDRFGDLLEYQLQGSGYDPLNPRDADCRLEQEQADSDGDGLRDCEERFIGTSPDLFDSDADGFPDSLEVRFGTNPAGDDVLLDPDFDGGRNGNELRAHTDPRSADASDLAEYGYRYRIHRQWVAQGGCPAPAQAAGRPAAGEPGQGDGAGDPAGGQQEVDGVAAGAGEPPARCLRYDFEVDNITLAATGERVRPDADGAQVRRTGENEIMLFVVEAPFDDPLDYGAARVACVRPRLRVLMQDGEPTEDRRPLSGVVHVPPERFVDPVLFDPALHCLEAR